jgi:hypothetical protein
MRPFMKSCLLFVVVCLASAQLGKAQVIVNPDGTHAVLTGNVIVNPNGTHSVLHGNILVNPDGTHAVLPITAPSGNMLNHNSGKVTSQFGQFFVKLFAKKDKNKVKLDREDRKRARGKFSVKRASNIK